MIALKTEERDELIEALHRNEDGATLVMDPQDTSFEGVYDDLPELETINAVQAIPCHY